jgi:hypothetical protein
MFVDCQRFVKELQQLDQGNARDLLGLPRIHAQLLARAHCAVACTNLLSAKMRASARWLRAKCCKTAMMISLAISA